MEPTREEKTSGEVKDFWQEHSLHYLEMAFRTDRREIVAQPDGHGKKTGVCGDTVEFFISMDTANIQSISYHSDGCLNTNACANTVVHLIEGKSLDEAWELTPEAVCEFLETLPENHFHCAELAVGALYLALSDVKAIRRAPWKKMYR